MLLLLTVTGTLLGIEDLGLLAPLLFRPTATVTIVPTHLVRQATLVITAVTRTPDVARYEVAARFVSATSPVLVASGQATGVTHVPATHARGTLTLYHGPHQRKSAPSFLLCTGKRQGMVPELFPTFLPEESVR